MQLYKVTIQKDVIWDAVDEFGNLAICHFLDLNVDESPYNLPQTHSIKECESSEKSIQYLLD
jgi:hypothetical protein